MPLLANRNAIRRGVQVKKSKRLSACTSCIIALKGTHVDQQAPELEQRLSELQAQVDRLNLSLHLWRQTQDDPKPMDRRHAQLTERCAEILDTCITTGV